MWKSTWNSIEVVHAIDKEVGRNEECVSLIKRIGSLIGMQDVARMEHAYRESNKCANVLANIDCVLDSELIMFDSVLSVLSRLLEDDVDNLIVFNFQVF